MAETENVNKWKQKEKETSKERKKKVIKKRERKREKGEKKRNEDGKNVLRSNPLLDVCCQHSEAWELPWEWKAQLFGMKICIQCQFLWHSSSWWLPNYYWWIWLEQFFATCSEYLFCRKRRSRLLWHMLSVTFSSLIKSIETGNFLLFLAWKLQEGNSLYVIGFYFSRWERQAYNFNYF